MAAINELVFDDLSADGINVVRVNTAAGRWSRFRVARVLSLSRVVSALLRDRGSRRSACYVGLSGGLGQWYDLVALLIARSKGIRRYIHHHSYAYLDRVNTLSRATFACAGKDAEHIVLAASMAKRLVNGYQVRRTNVVSNAAFLPPAEGSVRSTLRRIGFLSNITAAKGIQEFMDLAEACRIGGLTVEAVIAGPCLEEYWSRILANLGKQSSTVRYIGPVYGDAKREFFASIDVFVFPTKYVNEAEPLVVLEALQAGVPVIASDRGAIAEMTGIAAGKIIHQSENFVTAALSHLRTLNSPDELVAASEAARRAFVCRQTVAKRAWEQVKLSMAPLR